MHIFFKSQVIRARSFFANPKPAPRLKLNQLLKIDEPDDEVIANWQRRTQSVLDAYHNPQKLEFNLSLDDELEHMRDNFDLNPGQDLHECAIEGILEASEGPEPVTELPEELSAQLQSQCNIFSPENGSLLSASHLYTMLLKIERSCGANQSQAQQTAASILLELAAATKYPANTPPNPQENKDEILRAVETLIDAY